MSTEPTLTGDEPGCPFHHEPCANPSACRSGCRPQKGLSAQARRSPLTTQGEGLRQLIFETCRDHMVGRGHSEAIANEVLIALSRLPAPNPVGRGAEGRLALVAGEGAAPLPEGGEVAEAKPMPQGDHKPGDLLLIKVVVLERSLNVTTFRIDGGNWPSEEFRTPNWVLNDARVTTLHQAPSPPRGSEEAGEADLDWPSRTSWRCECGCRSYCAVQEQNPNGDGYRDSSTIRCVNCKRTFEPPPAPNSRGRVAELEEALSQAESRRVELFKFLLNDCRVMVTPFEELDAVKRALTLRERGAP